MNANLRQLHYQAKKIKIPLPDHFFLPYPSQMVGEIPKTLGREANAKHTRYKRYLIHLLLLHIEEGVDLLSAGKTEELVTFWENHNLLFGKASLVDAFLQLADLTLTLNQVPTTRYMKVVERNNSEFLRSTGYRCKELSLRKQRLETSTGLSIKNLSGHTALTRKEKKRGYIKMNYQ